MFANGRCRSCIESEVAHKETRRTCHRESGGLSVESTWELFGALL